MREIVSPSEGVTDTAEGKTREIVSPSEGVTDTAEGKTREIVSPSEGGRKTRGIVSPSEGGTGTAEGKTRLQGVLEAVMHLRTFGKWAENAGNRLTFGRWVSPRQGYVHGCVTATAPNRGICCHCGRRMERQSRSESSWQWFCGKGGTATAPNHGICCRCGRRMER